MPAHARLAPSAASRWLVCTASIRMEQAVSAPVGPSEYADEGTRAHTRAEIEASFAFRLISEEIYRKRLAEWELECLSDEERLDMEQYAMMYVAFLAELLKEDKHATLLLEQLVDTGVPGCWGTADAIIMAPSYIHVVDYKYGMGVRVDAEENPQTRLYGLGALDAFGDVVDTTKEVRMSIFQPRIDHVSHEVLTAAKLRRWRKSYVVPLAAEADSEHGRFNPTEEACRWCPARGECKPRMMKFTRMDFGDPDLMSPGDLSDAMDMVPEIRDWCSAVEDLALDKIYSQRVKVPGWKAVRSAGRRSIKDPEAAIKRLVKAGFKRRDVSVTKMRTLGDLEKLVGKEELPKILGPTLVKPEGSISIVSAADPRPSVDPTSEAQKDFSGESGGEHK